MNEGKSIPSCALFIYFQSPNLPRFVTTDFLTEPFIISPEVII